MEIILLLGYVPLVVWLLLQSVMLAKYDKIVSNQKQVITALSRANDKLKPFQVRPFGVRRILCAPKYYILVTIEEKLPPNTANVGGRVYNRTMKKRKPPLNKVAQATRNAHSAELFKSLLLNKHLVATPAKRKGSRKSNIIKAIKEYN